MIDRLTEIRAQNLSRYSTSFMTSFSTCEDGHDIKRVFHRSKRGIFRKHHAVLFRGRSTDRSCQGFRESRRRSPQAGLVYNVAWNAGGRPNPYNQHSTSHGLRSSVLFQAKFNVQAVRAGMNTIGEFALATKYLIFMPFLAIVSNKVTILRSPPLPLPADQRLLAR